MSVFLVCYSIDQANSLTNVKEKWVPELKHHAPDAKILLGKFNCQDFALKRIMVVVNESVLKQI